MLLKLLKANSANKASVSRAQFLRGNWRGVANIIPPPWALDGDAFFKTCHQCSQCITACPEDILSVGEKGYPKVDFSNGECTFCGKCEVACEAQALHYDGQAPWHYHAQINGQCLNYKGVMCRTCADCCDAHAISFQLMVGGFSSPELDTEACTGCGACIAPCPTDGIEMNNQLMDN